MSGDTAAQRNVMPQWPPPIHFNHEEPRTHPPDRHHSRPAQTGLHQSIPMISHLSHTTIFVENQPVVVRIV